MKVKVLRPIKGFAYFEGDVANIPDKVAKELLAQEKVEVYQEKEDKTKDKK